tara:strand:- start:468 stop:746 length:279 start_codon:yes stop_codon:yes gene_type:complete
MQLYDPTSSGPERHLTRAAALGKLDGAKIAIVENAKLNAPEMLHAIADLFVERHGCTVLPHWTKQNASAPAPADTLKAAAAKADFLITGLGD